MSGPDNRRAAGDGDSGTPEKLSRKEKTTTAIIEPIRLSGITSTEDLDLKVLQFKNKKLEERLEERQIYINELLERIEKLDKRQATDDTTLQIVNRYWAHLDVTVETILRRCDYREEGVLSSGTELPTMQTWPMHVENPLTEPGTSKLPVLQRSPLSEPALAFVMALGASSSEEVDLKLQGRMEFSKAAVAHIVKAFVCLQRRMEGLCQQVYSQAANSETLELGRENRRLQDLTIQVQEKHHRISLEYSELQDKVMLSETKVLEMETTVEDLEWDIEKLCKCEQKLNKHLADALEQLNSDFYVSGSSSSFEGAQVTLSMQKFEMLKAELEENQELANSRMAELEKLHAELQGAVQLNAHLKVSLRIIPAEVVRETGEYQMLQAQFSLLYNESLQVKTQLDEAQGLLLTTKNFHLLHIEHMECNEFELQKQLRTEVLQVENTLAQARKEYETLRMEFDLSQAANEQAGPINEEMRHLTNGLQSHNNQLKKDAQRYKRKLHEVQAEIGKLQAQASSSARSISIVAPRDDSRLRKSTSAPRKEDGERGPVGTTDNRKKLMAVPGTSTATLPMKKEELHPAEKDPQAVTPSPQGSSSRPREPEARPKKELQKREGSMLGARLTAPGPSRADRGKAKMEEAKSQESDVLKGLRAELKKTQDSQKEMKLLLAMYKSAPKEQRDKSQLMAAERKVKAEVDQLRDRVQELEEKDRRERKKIEDRNARRHSQQMKQLEHLRRKLAAFKHEEEALLSEMEVTGQAFEDMQEQNGRLQQQLREKDEANFKLMTERTNTNEIHKLLCEEKEELELQVQVLKSQVDAQLLTMQQLQEREQSLQGSLGSLERELMLCSQALELQKRKAVEATQLVEDLKVQLEHAHMQLQMIQPCVAESRQAQMIESFNLKRAQDDITRLQHKLDKQRKVEVVVRSDEILQEEIKEYKARLTCPCCKTREKDTVLTKCFHVFCFKCVRDRYEARQRKCPTCKAAFGAHDFHRVYIS